MSSSFHGGGEKGATSVLRNVGGRVDIDRSLHQDRYAPATGVAGPSRQQRPIASGSKRAAQVPNAFDLAALRTHLTPQTQPQQRNHEDWAQHFVPPPPQAVSSGRVDQRSSSPWHQDFAQSQQAPRAQSRASQQGPAPWQVPAQAHQPMFRPLPYHHAGPLPAMPIPMPMPLFNRPVPQPPMQEMGRDRTQPEQARQETRPAEPLTESQEVLARTARELVNDLDASLDLLRENPKLADSQFMQLMRGLGGGGVVVQDEQVPASGDQVGEGAKFVERAGAPDWASAFVDSSSQQTNHHTMHQARTLPALVNEPDFYERQRMGLEASFPDQDAITQAGPSTRPGSQRRKSVHFDEDMQATERSGVPNTLEEAMRSSTSIPGTSSQWQEAGLDLEDFDETAFMNFNGHLRQSGDTRIGVGDMEGWGEMQKDWDELQRSEAGMQRTRGEMDRYLFQSRNPYAAMEGDADLGRESPTFKGVLELEAAVQQDSSNHEAWYALGLKQQENEREDQAIRALTKVIDLDPDYRPAYLALAVSYTNEGEHDRARIVLSKWIDMAQTSMREMETETEELAGSALGHGRLVNRLIDLARSSPEEVDPDVQIALGVLFNSSEEYAKAEDCFSAALSVRPDDWLLHNRLGATLANSGRSNEAISYYHHALSLHPNFVRALFNLGISYINLAQYPLAAQHILSAIRLQHSDATEAYSSGTIGTSAKGVTSDALWNSLRTACLHMGRHDLVQLAGRKDITAFPDTFELPTDMTAQTSQ